MTEKNPYRSADRREGKNYAKGYAYKVYVNSARLRPMGIVHRIDAW
jgi:hypothetical protein